MLDHDRVSSSLRALATDVAPAERLVEFPRGQFARARRAGRAAAVRFTGEPPQRLQHLHTYLQPTRPRIGPHLQQSARRLQVGLTPTRTYERPPVNRS